MVFKPQISFSGFTLSINSLVPSFHILLSALLSTDDNLELVSDLDCVGYLIQALRDHTKHAKVVKNSCMALASLVEPDGK